MKDEAICRGL